MTLKQLNNQILQKGYKLYFDKIKEYIEKKLNKKISFKSDLNGVYINLSETDFYILNSDRSKIFELKKRTNNSYYIILIKSVDIDLHNILQQQVNKLINQSKEKEKNQSSSNS